MTTPVSYVSTGITVAFGTLAGELLDVDHGGESVGIVECPNQAGGFITKKSSNLVNPGSVTLTIGFDPDNAVIPATGTSSTLTITWPAGCTKKFSCSAILSKSQNLAAKLGTRIVNNLTLELSGTPNWSAS